MKANSRSVSRLVVLPDSLKREIQKSKLQRELRRSGIGQHTIERALNDRVRMSSYRKILAAIAEHEINRKMQLEQSNCTTQE